jgi:hypothetical protein
VENGVILGALKTTSLETSKRVLFPGAKYLPPEPQDKCDPLDTAALSALEKDYFALRERTQENVAEFIFSHVAGIALPTAREMAKRIHGEIAPFVKTFFENEPCTPCVAYAGGKPCDFFAFDVLGAKPAPSLAKAEDIFYTFREDEKLFFEKKLWRRRSAIFFFPLAAYWGQSLFCTVYPITAVVFSIMTGLYIKNAESD